MTKKWTSMKSLKEMENKPKKPYMEGMGKLQANNNYENIITSPFKKPGLFFSVGMSWEPKLNSYCTLSTGITYNLSNYNDTMATMGSSWFSVAENHTKQSED